MSKNKVLLLISMISIITNSCNTISYYTFVHTEDMKDNHIGLGLGLNYTFNEYYNRYKNYTVSDALILADIQTQISKNEYNIILNATAPINTSFTSIIFRKITVNDDNKKLLFSLSSTEPIFLEKSSIDKEILSAGLITDSFAVNNTDSKKIYVQLDIELICKDKVITKIFYYSYIAKKMYITPMVD